MSQGRESWDMEVIGAGHEGLAGQGKDFGSTLLSCFLLNQPGPEPALSDTQQTFAK